jgi:hypothetical protein
VENISRMPTEGVGGDSRDPHDSQVMKYNRFSLPRRVSGDRQILHVTYSAICQRQHWKGI